MPGFDANRESAIAWVSATTRSFNPEFPTLVSQAVFTPDGVGTEGQIVDVVEPAWRAIIERLVADPQRAHEIPPRKWEEIIAAAYRASGFDKVELTPHSADAGRDVIAVKSGWGAVRFVDQVKAYSPGHVVTAKEVRELGFAMLADRAATKGIVTTTSTFAPRLREDPLIKPYLPTRIELIDGPELIERLGLLIQDPQ